MGINIKYSDYVIPKFGKVVSRVMEHLRGGDGNLFVVLPGGRASTKSSFVSFLLVISMLSSSHSVVCLRKYQKDLRDSVMSQMVETIKRLGVSDLFEVRLSPLSLKCKATGSVCRFYGTEDASKLKSNASSDLNLGADSISKYQMVWLEEGYEHNIEEFQQVVLPTFLRGTSFPTAVFVTYNPPRDANASIIKFTEQLRDSEQAVVVDSTYLDVHEKWLGKSFLEGVELLKRKSESEYRHVYLGESSSLSTKIFQNYTFATLSDREIETLYEIGDIYRGVDQGYTDGNAFIEAVIVVNAEGGKDILYITREFYVTKQDPVEFKDMLIEYVGDDEFYIDSNNATVIAYLQNENYNAIGHLCPPLRAIPVNKSKMSVANKLVVLSELIDIVIDKDRTPVIAEELQHFVRDYNDKTGKISLEPKKNQVEHCIMALTYGVSEYLYNFEYLLRRNES